MFPTQAVAMSFTEIRQLRDHYQLPDDLWNSFTDIAGDPGQDLRLLAVLPPNVVSAALERATLVDGTPLTAVQASHVGLTYNLARRIQHTRGGGDWNSWSETSPFGQLKDDVTGTKETTAAGSSDRKLKMAQVLDQNDDSDFIVQGEEARARW